MNAWCSICGKEWDARDPGVRFLYGDGSWECTEEGPCFDRRAMRELDDCTGGEVMNTRKMDIPDPIYQWLLAIRADMMKEKGRNVMFAEVWEHVKAVYEAAELAKAADR